MNDEEQYILYLKEGGVRNYLDVLEQTLGGERSQTGYQYLKGKDKVQLSFYQVINELEVILLDIKMNKVINVQRQPDERSDFFHLTFIEEGQIQRNYTNQVLEDADTTKGLFLHNGLFALASYYPANLEMRTFSVKFSKDALLQIIPEANNLIESLFPDDQPRGYHTSVLLELENMVKDIFFYRDTDFGSKALVIGRSLELFTKLLSTLKSQQEKETLNGLHYDDYTKIMEVKDYLLNNLDKRVSIDEITDSFGISSSKLKRDFKALYNLSVYQFYTHAKMDEAYRRLKSGKYTVTEVGYDLGYSSLSKFSVMFKKVKGVSPSDVATL